MICRPLPRLGIGVHDTAQGEDSRIGDTSRDFVHINRHIELRGPVLTTAPLPSRRYRRVTLGLCGLWLVSVAVIVLSPSPVDSGAAGWLARVLAGLHRRGVPTWFDFAFVEFTANIVMFVPLGLFFFILAPRGWRWLGPVAGLALSVAIELTQLVMLPQRVATPYDVFANTCGTVVGTLVAWIALRARYRS